MAKKNMQEAFYTKRSLALSYMALGGISIVLAVLSWQLGSKSGVSEIRSQRIFQILLWVGHYGGMGLLGVLFFWVGCGALLRPLVGFEPGHLVLKGKRRIDYKDLEEVEDRGPNGLYLKIGKEGGRKERVKLLDTLVDSRQRLIDALAERVEVVEVSKGIDKKPQVLGGETALAKDGEDELPGQMGSLGEKRDIKTRVLSYGLVVLMILLTLLFVFSATIQGTWSKIGTWSLPGWWPEYILLMVMTWFSRFVMRS